jgi:hypothetical protein
MHKPVGDMFKRVRPVLLVGLERHIRRGAVVELDASLKHILKKGRVSTWLIYQVSAGASGAARDRGRDAARKVCYDGLGFGSLG